jgi:hypothetical protein
MNTTTQVINNDGATKKSLIQSELDQKLTNLKKADISNATVNIWIAKTLTTNKNKRFSEIKRLNVQNESKKKFSTYVNECIKGNTHISELKPIYTVQDNRFFHIESSATDLTQLIKDISTQKIESIKSAEELNKYNSYVIQLTFGNPETSIYAYHYISGAWSTKKTRGNFLSFRTVANELVVEIDQSARFEITPYIDFIQYQDDVFIADMKKFETAMNYHERLKEKKEEAITAFCSSPSIDSNGAQAFKDAVGIDKHLMRQLAAAHEKGYYTNKEWLTKLKKAADEAGNWKIKFNSSGEIEIDNDKPYIKELLILLQNKRVKTVVDGIIGDVDGELIALGQ